MPFAQRLTCTIGDACEVTGLGRTKLYELIGAGRIVTTNGNHAALIGYAETCNEDGVSTSDNTPNKAMRSIACDTGSSVDPISGQ